MRTRPGNPYLKAALGGPAGSSTRRFTAATPPPPPGLLPRHPLQERRRPARMEGANFSTRRDPAKAENNAVKRLNALGYQITRTPATAA
jgi:hypothetical protein